MSSCLVSSLIVFFCLLPYSLSHLSCLFLSHLFSSPHVLHCLIYSHLAFLSSFLFSFFRIYLSLPVLFFLIYLAYFEYFLFFLICLISSYFISLLLVLFPISSHPHFFSTLFSSLFMSYSLLFLFSFFFLSGRSSSFLISFCLFSLQIFTEQNRAVCAYVCGFCF